MVPIMFTTIMTTVAQPFAKLHKKTPMPHLIRCLSLHYLCQLVCSAFHLKHLRQLVCSAIDLSTRIWITPWSDGTVAQDCHREEEKHESRQGDPSQSITEIPNDLLFKVLRTGDRLVAMAPQLITNSTSNLAECFMSIRAKFDGGKFYNRVQKGSFEHRCQGAGLRWQLGLEWHTTAMEKVTNEEAGPILQAHVAHTEANR